MPKVESLYTNLGTDTESKALAMSIYITSVFNPSSNLAVQSFIHSNKFEVVECRARNPCCARDKILSRFEKS